MNCAAGLDTGTTWLDAGGSSSKVSALQLSTAVAGEMIEVLISLANPLAVDLHVSRLRLLFESEPMQTEGDLGRYAEVIIQIALICLSMSAYPSLLGPGIIHG